MATAGRTSLTERQQLALVVEAAVQNVPATEIRTQAAAHYAEAILAGDPQVARIVEHMIRSRRPLRLVGAEPLPKPAGAARGR